jgi:hypothetical protein
MAMVTKSTMLTLARAMVTATKRARARVARVMGTATRVVGNKEGNGNIGNMGHGYGNKGCGQATMTTMVMGMGTAQRTRPLML